MANLLMITGLGSVADLVSDKKGAFYGTLEEFHKYWDRIDIISPRIKGRQPGVKELFGNVFIHISPWPLLFHPIFFLRKGLEIYKKYKFDLMTVQEFPPFYNGIGARLLWQKIRAPYVLEIHHIPGYPRAGNFKEGIYRLFTKIFIKFDSSKAKIVRTVNQKEAPEFLKRAGVPAEKIRYIPSLYIDREIFRPVSVEKKYDLIFVGRLAENKGINLFLEVVKALDMRAMVVGSGPLKDSIKSKIINRKLKVDLHGWAKDSQEVADLINKSKVLVMPSYNEGGPRVVAEALACGVPVVATRVGIVPDIIEEGKNGYRADWDAEDIAEKIKLAVSGSIKKEDCVSSVAGFDKKEMIKNYAEALKSYIF